MDMGSRGSGWLASVGGVSVVFYVVLRIVAFAVGWASRPAQFEIVLYEVVLAALAIFLLCWALVVFPALRLERALRRSFPSAAMFGMSLRPEFGETYERLGILTPESPTNVAATLTSREFQIWQRGSAPKLIWSVATSAVSAVGRDSYFVGFKDWPTLVVDVNGEPLKLCPLVTHWYSPGPMSVPAQDRLATEIEAILELDGPGPKATR